MDGGDWPRARAGRLPMLNLWGSEPEESQETPMKEEGATVRPIVSIAPTYYLPRLKELRHSFATGHSPFSPSGISIDIEPHAIGGA